MGRQKPQKGSLIRAEKNSAGAWGVRKGVRGGVGVTLGGGKDVANRGCHRGGGRTKSPLNP